MSQKSREMKKTFIPSLEHFLAIFNYFPDAVSVNRLSDGQNLAINKSFTVLTGYATAKVGSWISYKDWHRLVAEVQKSGQANRLAVALHMKSGVVRRAQVVARQIEFENTPSLLIITSDITEQEKLSEALLESEIQLQIIFDNAATGIAFTDNRLIILRANRTLAAMVGCRVEDLIGQPVSMFTVPEDYANEEALLREMFEGQRDQYRLEKRSLAKDGRIFWTDVAVSAVRAADGKLRYLLGMIMNVDDQKRVEEDREKLLQEVRQAHSQLQVLSAQMFQVQENERRNIAYDMHDEIGQAILAVKANLEIIQLMNESAAIAENIAASVKIADNALEQIRSMALDLRPAMLDDFGLAATLEWYLERQARTARFKISFQSDLPDRRFPPVIETAGFRVAQTAIMNIVRHSQAQHIHVTLGLIEDRELELVIRDDGIGFDVTAALEQAQHGQSLGLLGLQERVRLVGGKSTIKSTLGLGTEIRVRFPIKMDEG